MTWIIDNLKWLISLAKPENLQALVHACGPPWVAYAALFAIVFSETGLLVGFFLPGDSLLFSTGLLASQNLLNIWTLIFVLCAAAILGDAFNYMLGRQMSEHVLEQGRLRFVKHKHLMAAHAFYEKHGGKAIVLARFVPIVRTFVPFVAGVAKMSYHQFALFNIAGGIGWVVSMTAAGYWLGQIEWVKQNFEKVVIAIVVISIAPLVIEFIKHWLASRKAIHPIPAEQGEL